MKIFSYTTANLEEVPEKRKWINDLGLRIVKEQQLQDTNKVVIIFIVPDEETEIMLKLKFGLNVFKDRTA